MLRRVNEKKKVIIICVLKLMCLGVLSAKWNQKKIYNIFVDNYDWHHSLLKDGIFRTTYYDYCGRKQERI